MQTAKRKERRQSGWRVNKSKHLLTIGAAEFTVNRRVGDSILMEVFVDGKPLSGKLRLKGEIAKRDADVSQQGYEAVRRSVLAGVKAAYFQLAYLSRGIDHVKFVCRHIVHRKRN
jgi:hypothetical protein